MKFKQPVAMKVTKQQYTEDLEKPLLEMGYTWADDDVCGDPDYPYLENWYDECINGSLGVINEAIIENLYSGRTVIDHYNPELFLALAAMTENEDPIPGEYMICIKNTTDCTPQCCTGQIFQIKSFNTCERGLGHMYLGWSRDHFRKATSEELINYFTKKLPENWCIKGCEELASWVRDYEKDSRSKINIYGDGPNLYYSNDFINPHRWNASWGIGDKTLITFDQLKPFLPKLKSNTMKKYKIKDTSKYEAIKALLKHTNLSEDFTFIESYDNYNILKDAGVLHWLEEIPTTKEFVIGKKPFTVKVENGKAFHKNDDISEFVKKLVTYCTGIKTAGAYHFEIDDVTFKSVGCEKESYTTLEEWKQVYKELNVN